MSRSLALFAALIIGSAYIPWDTAIAQQSTPFDVGEEFQEPLRLSEYKKRLAAEKKAEVADVYFAADSGRVLFVLWDSAGKQYLAPLEVSSKPPATSSMPDPKLIAATEEFSKSDRPSVGSLNAFLHNFYPAVTAPRELLDANEKSEVLKASRVVDSRVVAQGDEALGTITDIVIERPDHRIAYLLVRDEQQRTQAVPLGAFEYTYSDSAWQIDLEPKFYRSMPTVKSDELPKQVDRGWLEYVRVRFGRNSIQDPAAVEAR